MSADASRTAIPFDVADISNALQNFVDRPGTAFEAVADNLVAVRVGPSLTVLEVRVMDPKIKPDQKRALEVAFAGAVNMALQKAALAAGAALAELEKMVTSARDEKRAD